MAETRFSRRLWRARWPVSLGLLALLIAGQVLEHFVFPRGGQTAIFLYEGLAAALLVAAVWVALTWAAREALRREAAAGRLAALNRLIQVINSTLDLQVAFEAFVAEAQALLPLDRASLGVSDEAAQALRMLAASGLMGQQIGRGRLVPMKDNARVANAIARCQTDLVGDLEREQASPMDARLAQEGIRAAMVVPIIAHAEVIGVLNLGTYQANAYTTEHVALAEQLAAQFATAVVNARLYEQEQKRARQLATLNEVSARIMAILQVDDLLPAVATLACEGFGFSRTSIGLLDGESIVIKACACEDCNPCPEVGERIALDELDALPASELVVPLRGEARVVGVITVRRADESGFDENDLATLQALANQVSVALEKARLHEQVVQEAITDGLTGLYNHRFLDVLLQKELAACARYRHGLAVLMLDIDHFKQYNDAHGHPAGDAVLQQVARLLQKNVRGADLVARYGGEEFTIVLPETNREGALAAAEKIRAAVEVFPFLVGRLTVSIGVAVCEAGCTDEDLVGRADRALYAAKNAGRNCVRGEETAERPGSAARRRAVEAASAASAG
ncbi:MAG: diguanylate cyclase [Ardenticatenaceae bacterium]|nr:diguanylate cyclase [Ardenticatenaceae bacterium]